MHKTRRSSTIKLPIVRKGTKYIARASSHLNNSVPVVIAIRDMLKLARTAKEVKKMIQQKLLKLNGKPVKDYRQSILLFNILEADKKYELSMLPTGKFVFVPSKKSERLCKVMNKRLVQKGAVQLNLHDGTNLITKEKINVGDSLYLDFEGKIKKHVAFSKGKEAFAMSGRYVGQKVQITEAKDGKVSIDVNGGSAHLNKSALIVL